MSYTIDTSHHSPNHSSRGGAPISMIVMHATVGSYAASLAWLTNPASKVSTHYLIRKDGHIAQLVPTDLAAWHAGKSVWRGLNAADIQACSLGIELENANDGHDPYPPAQVGTVTALCRDLIDIHGIQADFMTRHLDIAIPAGRKTDPASFPWSAFLRTLYPPTARYRVKADMFWLEDRRADAPIANGGRALLRVDDIIAVDNVTDGWAHAENGIGFTLLAGLEAL